MPHRTRPPDCCTIRFSPPQFSRGAAGRPAMRRLPPAAAPPAPLPPRPWSVSPSTVSSAPPAGCAGRGGAAGGRGNGVTHLLPASSGKSVLLQQALDTARPTGRAPRHRHPCTCHQLPTRCGRWARSGRAARVGGTPLRSPPPPVQPQQHGNAGGPPCMRAAAGRFRRCCRRLAPPAPPPLAVRSSPPASSLLQAPRKLVDIPCW